MWISNKVIELFKISKETIDSQKEDLSTLRLENLNLKVQLANTQANFNWLTTRVNVLEVERAQLIERAYGIKTIVPEIAQKPQVPIQFQSDLFEDMGEKLAKLNGFQTYESPFENAVN